MRKLLPGKEKPEDYRVMQEMRFSRAHHWIVSSLRKDGIDYQNSDDDLAVVVAHLANLMEIAGVSIEYKDMLPANVELCEDCVVTPFPKKILELTGARCIGCYVTKRAEQSGLYVVYRSGDLILPGMRRPSSLTERPTGRTDNAERALEDL